MQKVVSKEEWEKMYKAGSHGFTERETGSYYPANVTNRRMAKLGLEAGLPDSRAWVLTMTLFSLGATGILNVGTVGRDLILSFHSI